MNDLISRQEAIKELESGKDKKAKGEIGGFYNQIIENDIKKLKKLPTAQPERTGKWIKPTGMMPPEYNGVYRCSECGEIAMRDWKRHCQTLTNYCPNCGAKMKEGN